MKRLPAPNVPGNTDAERFDNAVRKMFYRFEGRRAARRGEVEPSTGAEEAGKKAALTVQPTHATACRYTWTS